jgi:predicted enzyme related to lactoylglutathione lyase
MNKQPQFGFLLHYVSDIPAARRFYVDVLGLKVEREHPTYIQFEHFALASDESMSGERQPEAYWLVEDARQAYAEISPKAELVMPLREMPFGTVFGIRDPSGQTIYLLEFARNRPSRPVE